MIKNKLTRNFIKIPPVRTGRLLLRRISPRDADDMYAYASLPEVTEYLLWSPHPSREYTVRYIDELQQQYRSGNFFDWGLEYSGSGRMIGTCGFTSFDESNNCAEVGYVLSPYYWGHGLAAEALAAVLGIAFEQLELNRVEARFMTGNERSRRVMEKCGMKFEGVRREAMFVKNQYRDIGYCSILNGEYYDIYGKTREKTQDRTHWYDRLR